MHTKDATREQYKSTSLTEKSIELIKKSAVPVTLGVWWLSRLLTHSTAVCGVNAHALPPSREPRYMHLCNCYHRMHAKDTSLAVILQWSSFLFMDNFEAVHFPSVETSILSILCSKGKNVTIGSPGVWTPTRWSRTDQMLWECRQYPRQQCFVSPGTADCLWGCPGTPGEVLFRWAPWMPFWPVTTETIAIRPLTTSAKVLST